MSLRWLAPVGALLGFFVLASGGGAVQRTDAITTIAGGGSVTTAGSVAAYVRKFTGPADLAVNPDGTKIYVADDKQVYEVTRSGGSDTSRLLASFGAFSKGLAVSPDGKLAVVAGCSISYVVGTQKESVAGPLFNAGLCGYAGDGLQAGTGTRFNGPQGIAFAPNGTLYVADTRNNRVRFIEDGIVETLAGTGVAGETGDGGSATSARIHTPRDVAVDGSGVVYITTATRVRRVDRTGKISTAIDFASLANPCSAGTAAVLGGMARDAAGNIYVVVSSWNQIYKISSGSATRLIGSATCGASFTGDGGEAGEARLERVMQLDLDRVGSLYIVANDRVRYVRNFPPRAALSASTLSGPAPLTVTFNLSDSYDPNGRITSWTVQPRYPRSGVPRTGAKARGRSYTYEYRLRGTYIARLTVVDDSGATDVAQVTIRVR